ncbi:GTPase-activating protein [Saccharomycopsis crataegensis]|uniref:GTPase-activating protein n=1 Tax=Saccharomycopsis crataegensis TaxID=43959 RepID=A0AAV5QLY6_9ASCO|nr:GTPase-activating protein [Saccharomycopsis crataegensis]
MMSSRSAVSSRSFTTDDLRHYMVQDKGSFTGDLEWSDDNSQWQTNTLQINSIGQLTISYSVSQCAEVDNNAIKLKNHKLFNLGRSATSRNSNNRKSSFQKRRQQDDPDSSIDISTNPYSDVIIRNLHSSSVSLSVHNGISTIQVVSVNKEKCYFKSINNEKPQFVRFLANLMVWQNMNVYGIHNKYFNIPLPFATMNNPQNMLNINNGGANNDNPKKDSVAMSQSILIYDDDDEDNVIVINKEEKNLLVCRFKVYGPIPKNQRKNLEIPGPRNPLYPSDQYKDVQEGWFYAMGVVKSNGILDLLSEYDGTLLYSINVSTLIRSEIRQVHHSIFENSNVLFLGVIEELRDSNMNSNLCPTSQRPPFFLPSPVVKFNELRNFPVQRILLSFPLHIDLEDWFVALKSLAAGEYVGISSQYSTKSSFRIYKKLHVDVLEANLSDCPVENSDSDDLDDEGNIAPPKLYTDIIFWDSTWARTSIVQSSKSPFWREEFVFDLPILTSGFQMLIKKCVPSSVLNAVAKKQKNKTSKIEQPELAAGDKFYSELDTIVGIVTITEEIIDESKGKETWVPVYSPTNNLVPIGQICVRLSLKEWHILLPSNFDTLQKMLINTSLADIIEFLSSSDLTSKYEDLEEISNMMLDIFQALHKEELWFSELIDFELRKVGVVARSNHAKSGSMMRANGMSTNFFNTLFRGNSILSKTFEKYNLRVGQEFLEKVVGEFVLQVAEDNYDCEIDPARIRGSTEEKEAIIDENFMKLFDYVEMIWEKIYNSCNDLPAPIRRELEIFRNKLENCGFLNDPNDLDINKSQSNLALNCVTGFLFLRLICPAILNPKLFFLIKDHQTGNIKRTLTLISKILLTLSNRTRFGAKEPWLIKMNYFLEQHESELLEYLDIITNRKLDHRPKILDLSDTVIRPDISISPQISIELPTNPFLIDKYFRLTQLATILAAELENQQDEFNFSDMGNSSGPGSVRNSFKIGSMKFDEQVMKNNNLAYASEELLRNLSQINAASKRVSMMSLGAGGGINSNRGSISTDLARHSQVSIGDVKQESYYLLKKISRLDYLLTSFENPSLIYGNWGKFVNTVIESSIIDQQRRILYLNINNSSSGGSWISDPNIKKLTNDGIASLKIKFTSPKNSTPPSTPTSPIRNSVGLGGRNGKTGGTASIILGAPPRLGKLIRSASSSTLGGRATVLDAFTGGGGGGTNESANNSFSGKPIDVRGNGRANSEMGHRGSAGAGINNQSIRYFQGSPGSLPSSPAGQASFGAASGGTTGGRSPFKKTFFWRKKNNAD